MSLESWVCNENSERKLGEMECGMGTHLGRVLASVIRRVGLYNRHDAVGVDRDGRRADPVLWMGDELKINRRARFSRLSTANSNDQIVFFLPRFPRQEEMTRRLRWRRRKDAHMVDDAGAQTTG